VRDAGPRRRGPSVLGSRPAPVLALSAALLASLFLPWTELCLSATAFPDICETQSGWAVRLGWPLGALLAALIAWETIELLGLARSRLVSASLAAMALLVTMLKLYDDRSVLNWPAWLALALAGSIMIFALCPRLATV
jgi:hypothetical protein